MTFSLVSIPELFASFWQALQHGAVLPLGNWNYLILFVFVIMQGPLVKLLGGALVANTFMNLFTVILVSILASLTADVIWFRIGRLGNPQRFLKRRSAKQKKVFEKLQIGMNRHCFKVLLLGKFATGMTVPAMIAAGVSKIPWRRWVPAVLLGEIIYTSTVVTLGFFAAESVKQVDQTLQAVGIGVTAIILLVLVIYLPRTLKKILEDSSPPKEFSSTD